MRLQTLVLLFFLATTFSFSQSLKELDERNGFKDIKLVTPVTDYPGLELKKSILNQDTTKYQEYTAVKGAYKLIGKIPVRNLTVKTYKGVIYDIEVVCKRDGQLYRGLEKAFGRPHNYKKVGYGDYFWKTENVKLTFRSHSKTKLALSYHSYALEAKLKSEKEENLQAISNDF